MPPKKGKKKSKAELEQERLEAEEAERLAHEAEMKRLEEERIAAEAAAKKLKEEQIDYRTAELGDLGKEYKSMQDFLYDDEQKLQAEETRKVRRDLPHQPTPSCPRLPASLRPHTTTGHSNRHRSGPIIWPATRRRMRPRKRS